MNSSMNVLNIILVLFGIVNQEGYVAWREHFMGLKVTGLKNMPYVEEFPIQTL